MFQPRVAPEDDVPLTIKVDILTETELPNEADLDSLISLVNWVLMAEQQIGDWSISVVLTSDDALRALHVRFMGIDTETDVMTFPAGNEDGTTGGDIAISVERAADQAPEYGLSTWEEIRFLAVHGALHLCGWQDHLDNDRDAMLARQRELITAFDRSGAG